MADPGPGWNQCSLRHSHLVWKPDRWMETGETDLDPPLCSVDAILTKDHPVFILCTKILSNWTNAQYGSNLIKINLVRFTFFIYRITAQTYNTFNGINAVFKMTNY